MVLNRLVNLKGDLFATGFSYAAQSVVKFCSSLILTRILLPEAYGVITILMSIVFVVEMLSDIGINVFIIRDERAEEPRILNTAWTVRLGRSMLNTAVVCIFAPQLSASLYDAPSLAAPLRVISLLFVSGGLESMSFPLAIRRKRTRIIVYSELAAAFLSAIFTVVYCAFSRDYWGMVYGTVVGRLLITAFSYGFYREHRPRLQLDLAAARHLFRFTRYTMPSSIITLALSQFDKVVFLRLFSFDVLGVYGLASGIAAPIESLISKISQLVLYPRCAHNFRTDRDNFSLKYYTENIKLFGGILIVPAVVGGAAHFLITVLYPFHYAATAAILQAWMLRAAMLALASPAEDLLIAAGHFQVILIGQVGRAIWMIGGSLVGNYLFGFTGFTYGVALSGLPPLVYYWWLQREQGLMVVKYELYKVAFTLGVAVSAYVGSSLLLPLWHTLHIKI